MRKIPGTIALILLGTTSLAAPAAAEGLDLAGSLGAGRFTHYVPPVTHPTLNETPFITTEVKPIFLYHSIPSGFVTDGGRVIGGAVQARLALGERFAIIATTDGYADLDFDGVLPDADGFLDLAAGVKYALLSNPAAGEILTAGVRYTASTGNIDSAGIDLTGSHKGFLDTFLTGAKIWDSGWQAQGAVGFQWGIGAESWSYFHLHGHLDYEVAPGVYPLIEANLLLPVDGGDRIPGSSLTSVDLFDIGAEDTQGTFTLAIGARYRPMDNLILGAAVEGNILDLGADTAESVFGWRVTTDVTIHF
ncbi:hypothetical protein LNKW23_44990 [Paralimibaculum aggregatum]|uniref:Outer membrane beta-barrel porin/alpha-amylase n=1 Tax=Paralimibaculum aggregatum TaxID=3036245 RepID=A0ABQ6LTA0_9RHOB|nr:hypothetical protein [Limibaculum sp. NKW23]GMG85281.1 hypothetical protein LNKW23_44990 [Limibaculum sp. NKW23]